MTRIPEFVELLEVSCRDSLLCKRLSSTVGSRPSTSRSPGSTSPTRHCIALRGSVLQTGSLAGGLLQERLSVQPGQSCSEDVELFSPERARASLVEG